jgi:hypothetical protein
MMAGAIGLAVYSVVVCHLLVRAGLRAAPATLLSLVVWLIVAYSLLAVPEDRYDVNPLFAVITARSPMVRIRDPLRARRRRDAHSGCWPLRLHFRCWWKVASRAPLSARRSPG